MRTQPQRPWASILEMAQPRSLASTTNIAGTIIDEGLANGDAAVRAEL